MRALLAPLVLIGLCLLCAAPVRGLAQETPAVVDNAKAGTTPIAGDGVYRAFHEKAGIDRVVAHLVDRYHSDPRLKDIFATVEDEKLKTLLGQQICYITGGGCGYTGRDMKAAHKNMGVQVADFNALVEDLQLSMDDEHVPMWAQDKLLAKLAPMERAVVTH